jgi:DNA-binding response OmpR family regulator
MRALIADDDRVTRRTVESLLTDWGYPVVVAEDGTEAWEVVVETDEPLLAILDWDMPGMTGPEICRRVRASRANHAMFLILLTGRNELDSEVEAFEAGADDFIAKPFDTRELRMRVYAGARLIAAQWEVFEIYRTAPVPMLLVDRRRDVRRHNDAAESLLVKPLDAKSHTAYGAALGCVHALKQPDHCQQSQHCDECTLHSIMLSTLDRGENRYREEVSLQRGESAEQWLYFLVTSTVLTSDAEVLALVCLEDITHQKRIEHRLQETVDQLQRFNRLAVGRELRMIELKRTVNGLCRRLGVEAPHDLSFLERDELLRVVAGGGEVRRA